MGPWKHMDRMGWGSGVDKNGAAWLYQWWGPMAWAIAAQWLQVFSGGPGQPLGWANWAQPGSGALGPKWRRGNKGLLYPGDSPQMS